ncbi:MAG: hypothetical protein ABMA01_03610 [Chthoniobacteraceae bacterium]
MYWLRVRRSVLRSDDEAVVTPSGTRVPYASITSVDQRKWKSKGLATVYYTMEGAKRRFVLDDAKYEPEGLDVILEDILKRTGGETGVK